MQRTGRARLRPSPGVMVPAATITANVLSYALFLAAARLLDRATYGETLALLSLVTIATIPQFAIQTVIARRVATDTLSRRTLRMVVAIGLAGGVLLAALSPFLVSFMRLSSYTGVLGAAASVPPLTMLGLAIGAAQGRGRWGALSAGLVLMGIGRIGGGLVGLIWDRSAGAALIGTAIGLLLAAVVALRVARTAFYESPVDPTQQVSTVLVELAHAAHAHGAFLLLSSLDLILARNILSAEEAGLYAAGNVVFRAALWLPQPVQMMLFASMSDRQRHRRVTRNGLAIVAALVGATVLVCLLFGDLVAVIVGGESYRELGDFVWLFAVAGGGLALLQLAVYAGLAILRRGRLAIIWACIAAEIAAMYALGQDTDPQAFITVIALIAAGAAVVAVVLALSTRPGPDPDVQHDTEHHGDETADQPEGQTARVGYETGTKTTDPL